MKIIGHRGARGLAPENTIVSLQKAVDHGVEELEFDLRSTKDDVVVVHHDSVLVDPSGNKLVIRDNTFEKLREHKPDLATFKEILDHFPQNVVLLIEVKQKERIEPIVAMLKDAQKAGWQNEYLLLGSKDQTLLRDLHEALPEIEKVIIERWSSVRAMQRAKQVDAKRLSMNHFFLWRGVIKFLTDRGYKVAAYPLNNTHRANAWARYGLHGVITDFPDRFEK